MEEVVDITRDFIKESLDLEQRKKNLEKLEDNVNRIKDIEDLLRSMPRAARRKMLKGNKFSDKIKEIYKNK